jgi:formylmethanofuran dehydrogenase subunit E
MSQKISESSLLQAAGRFHGHIGPFLAIGLRMGLVANERLGRAPMDTSAVVTVEPKPPKSCLVDGIQFSTGCTMGKRNIMITPAPEAIAVAFSRGADTLTVALRADFLERLERELAGAAEKAVIDYAFRIMDTPTGELFEVT